MPPGADLRGDVVDADSGAGNRGQGAERHSIRVARTRLLLYDGVAFI